MSDRFDAASLGELLIDFTVNGESAQGNSIFEANPGGAPCNVLAMLRKLHKTCAFIGKAGGAYILQKRACQKNNAGWRMEQITTALRLSRAAGEVFALVITEIGIVLSL